MNHRERIVATVPELLAAVRDKTIRSVVIANSLTDLPGFALAPGQRIRGASREITLTFADGVDGICVCFDNRVENLCLVVTPDRRAVFNDLSVPRLGRIELRNVTTVGRVQILARDQVKDGHVEVNGLDVITADATGESDRPHGYGVYALQGAFTLWNQQSDPGSVLTANLVNISVGRLDRPVLGSGIFVAGAGDTGGRVDVQSLETGPVYSDGRIAPGTNDQITGGVGVWSGASVDVVRCRGPAVTYGTNDMALDNWGVVDRWWAEQRIVTRGPSGIGFVNFGTIGDLRLDAPVETFGSGSRGFNVYEGSVSSATFDRIVTHGDGAVGVQIARSVGQLTVRRGIETFGGKGRSLVKGVLTELAAVALSIRPGGVLSQVRIDGGLRTRAKDIPPLENHGMIDNLSISGGFAAVGG
jgi:hypothetical protein